MKQNCKIFHPMNQLCIRSSLRTIRVLVVHLLLINLCECQSRLIGSSQPIVANVGDDVILPCHLDPAVDVATKTLEWTRTDLNPRFVFVWRAGQDYESIKNPLYKGRTSLFIDELKRGNISLKLSNVKPADEGRYRCYIPDRNEDSLIQLVVEDFYQVQSSFSAIIVGLAVGLTLCVMLILLLVFFLWRKEKMSKRNKQDSTKGNVEMETNDVEENVDDTNNQLQEEEDKRNVKEKTNKFLFVSKRRFHMEKQRREEAEKQAKTLSEELTNKSMETDGNLTTTNNQLQEEKLKRWKAEAEVTTLKNQLQDEIQRRKETEEQLNKKLKEKTKEVQTLLTERNRLEKDVETKQKELKQLSDEKKKLEVKVKKLEEIKETTDAQPQEQDQDQVGT